MKIKTQKHTGEKWIVYGKKGEYDRNDKAKIFYKSSYLGAKRFINKHRNKLFKEYYTIGISEEEHFYRGF